MPAASFMPDLLKKVIDGDKTQTRRLCLPGQRRKVDDNGAITHIRSAKMVTQWQVGREYAVKAGRVSPGVLWSPTRGIVTDYRAAYRDIFGTDAPQGWKPKMLRFCLTGDTGLVAVTMKVTELRVQDVREISEEDALAEGFQDRSDFWFTWVEMYDKSWLPTYRYASDMGTLKEYGFFQRPDNRYEANAITFEVHKGLSK
jgi:hypothetical protein